jgi:transcriptional regulator
MTALLSNRININCHPVFKGNDLVEIKIIYKSEDSRNLIYENLGEFLLTKEAAIQFAQEIMSKYDPFQ